MQKEMYGQFENTFMMYLPRLCEHCLNPACVTRPVQVVRFINVLRMVLRFIDQISVVVGACV